MSSMPRLRGDSKGSSTVHDSTPVATDAELASAEEPDRTSRRRWAVPALIALVVVCAGLAGAALRATNDETTGNPAAPNFENYDPGAMRDRLVSASRTTFGTSLPAGSEEFAAGATDFRHLTPAEYGAADFMYVTFGDQSQRSLKVFVGHTPESVSVSDFCKGLNSGIQISCYAREDSGGTLTVTTVTPLRGAPDLGPDKSVTVKVADIDEAELSAIHIERNVRVIRAGGFTTSITERVVAPKSLDESIFTVSTESMKQLASDGNLAVPYPAKAASKE
jgi:hypothetical protein